MFQVCSEACVSCKKESKHCAATEILSDFFQWNSAHEVQQEIDQIVLMVMASPDLDCCSSAQRSSLMAVIQRLTQLVHDLESFNRELKNKQTNKLILHRN